MENPITAEINFTSLKPDSDETRIMHMKSDNTEIMIGSDTNEVIKELFKSFLQRYQEGLQEKMRGSDFEFDGIHLLYYDFNKISLNRRGSYIESAKWIKDKKSTINPKNNVYKCFQYALTVVTVTMITDGEKWHYTAVTRLSGSRRGVTGNNNGDFYCFNCFHEYRTENKLEKHKKICENHDYCHVEMPNEDNKIIKYNQGEKSIRSPFIIHADLECLLEKNKYLL